MAGSSFVIVLLIVYSRKIFSISQGTILIASFFICF